MHIKRWWPAPTEQRWWPAPQARCSETQARSHLVVVPQVVLEHALVDSVALAVLHHLHARPRHRAVYRRIASTDSPNSANGGHEHFADR